MIKIISAFTVSLSLGLVKEMLPDLCKKYQIMLLSSTGKELDEISENGDVQYIAFPMERYIS